MLLGQRNSLYISSLLYIAAIALSYVPFASPASAYYNNAAYALPIALTGLLLAYVAYGCISRNAGFLRQARSISLAALAIGLLGFLAGALY